MFVVGSMFGWVNRKSQARRYRIAYAEVAKKNGKTAMAAGVGLLLAFFDGEAGAEVYSGASSRKQAMLVWKQARDFVRTSPGLSERIKIYGGIDSNQGGNMSRADTNSKFEPLSADYGKTDGINPHGGVLDELHEHKNRGIWDIVTKSTITRAQPMVMAITTAGVERSSVCWEQREYTEDVLSGAVEDDAWFGYVATVDKDDDWKDKKAWKKANPNLGVTIDTDAFRGEFEKARNAPAKENSFKRYNLNIWTQQATRIWPLEWWEACPKPRDGKKLMGQMAFGGLDLAVTRDISAYVLIIPDDNESIDVVCKFWCPETDIELRTKARKRDYQQWADAGLITVTPGDTTDYAFIEKEILESLETYHVVSLGYDPAHATYLVTRLQDRMGDDILKKVPQGYWLSEEFQTVERMFQSTQIRHGSHPVLQWMYLNVSDKTNETGLRKLDKANSHGRVDGIAALTNAVHVWKSFEGEKKSVYETRDPIILET